MIATAAEVIRLDPADTHDLRRRVLRHGDADAHLDWPGDHDDDTVHLGVVVDGDVVAISTWLTAPLPDTGEPGVQLRGMATDPVFERRGLGGAVLDAGVSAARQRGMTLVWANSRVTALGFYQRAGFDVIGPVFATADTGMPHRRVRLDLGPVSPSSS